MKNYLIGRGKPPKHTRWKKGQTGNPRRLRKRRLLDVASMIEQAFARHVHITVGTETERRSAFEAILLQLWTKAVKGNVRATRVFLKYQDFVAAQSGFGGVELQFEDEL